MGRRKIDITGKRFGNYKHGECGTRTYRSWRGMLNRCKYKNHKDSQYYQAKGITVCRRWFDYLNFKQDMGEAPPGKSIDRIDSNGDYCKKNCRWATDVEQHRNTSYNRNLKFKGRVQCLQAWATELGISRATLNSRIRSGWTVQHALTRPVGAYLHERGLA